MSFTRQHYKAIASIICDLKESGDGLISRAELIKALADYFEADNKRFNRQLFIYACRVKA